MNQPEQELARKLVQHLDHGLDHLEPGVRQRLAVARNAALARYRAQPQAAHELAGGGGIAAWFGDGHGQARQLVLLSALLLAAAAYFYWPANGGPSSELAEIDASLLTDELPVNAYLDKGFDSWLKRSPR
ncbi:hypothetical protein D3C83_11190 [compost metagenome]